MQHQQCNTNFPREIRAQAPPKAGFLWRRGTCPRPRGAYQHFVFCDYVTSNEGRDVLGDEERRTGQKVRWPNQQPLLRHVHEDSLHNHTQHGREVCVNGLSLNGLLLYAKKQKTLRNCRGGTSGKESSSEDGSESEGSSSVSRRGEENENKTDRRGRGLGIDVPGIRGVQHTATHCNTLQRTATHCNT